MNERRSPLLAFTAFEQALLRSADADEAPRGAAERALGALGAGGSQTEGSLNGAATMSGAVVPSPNPAWSLWQKPLLLGVLGGVGVALSARVIDTPPEPSSSSAAATSVVSSARPTPPAPARPAIAASKREAPAPPKLQTVASVSAPILAPESAVPAAPAPLALPPLPPIPVATASTSTPGHAGTDTDSAAARSSSIAAEVLMVDRARGALRQGRVKDALAELTRYRELWPLGVLTPEVNVLQIEAELKAGARESARRRAAALIRAQPNSRYAARLRSLFDAGELP